MESGSPFWGEEGGGGRERSSLAVEAETEEVRAGTGGVAFGGAAPGTRR